jgi:pimeloyl-ACP methyl ester carboxylesterase
MDDNQSIQTGQVVSADGTRIGYRQLGSGPGLMLVHGGMQSSQNFTRLAAALADTFTLYLPDRRGRGLSGPHGNAYCLARECEDIQALVDQTGADNIFGLSSGAIVVLQSALVRPHSLRKVALYEPPLPVGGFSPISWVPRFDSEIARGELAAAMVTVMKGTGDSSFLTLLPRFVLVPLLKLAVEADAREAQGDNIPIKALIPTMHFDPQLVVEMEGKLETFRALQAEVLLLGGSQSQKYLTAALDALGGVLPHARRVEFSGVGHLAADNSGQPERVAQELRAFFAD